MRSFPSQFQHRLWFAHHIGSIQKIRGCYVSLPLYHRRPPKPFEPRLTRVERIELDDWLERIPTIGG